MLAATLGMGTAQADTIKLVTGNNYFPYTDASLPGGGLAAQIVTRVFAELGFETEYSFEGWEEGYAKARDGYYIGTFPYIITAKRKQEFLYTAALFEVRPTLFWSVERKHRILDLSDVAGKTVCVPEGWAVDGYLKPMLASGDLRQLSAASMRGCFQKVYDGEIDLVSADRRVGEQLAEDIDAREWIKSRRFAADSTSNHLLFTRKHPQAAAWVKAFDTALATLRENGALYEIVRAYYSR